MVCCSLWRPSYTPALSFETLSLHGPQVVTLCNGARLFQSSSLQLAGSNQLTPWSRFLLEKLTGFQIVKKFPAFYGTRRFITSFTTSGTRPYPGLAQSSPHTHNPPPADPSQYYPPIYAWVFKVVSFPQVSPPKPCVHLCSPPYVLYALPTFFSI